MRILTYVTAALLAFAGAMCFPIVSKVTRFFEGMPGVELPLLTRFVLGTSGAVPAGLLFIFAVILVALGVRNSKHAAWASIVLAILGMILLGFMALALWLPLRHVTGA